MRSMKNWQGMPTTRLTSGGEVMVPRDNSTLEFSTELLNYIIAFATQGKAGAIKYLTVDLTAIPMTSSSRDISFHTPSGNQTEL